MSIKTTWSLVCLVALAAALPAQQGQEPPQLTEIGGRARKIVDEHVAGVVTISYVVKIEWPGDSQERRLQSRGMLASGTGLILTEAGVVAPNVNVRVRGRKINDVKTTVEDIKVVFGNEEEEQDAFPVGNDSKLGFGFLQVRDFAASERAITIPDYDKAEDPGIGTIVVTPNRLEKGFDYAPYFTFGWITGEVKKPRKAYLVSTGTNIGLPAYDLSGKLVGAHARLRPVSGGTARTVLLKGGVVNGAIQQAQKRAEKMLAEQKSDGDGK